jgi:integrase
VPLLPEVKTVLLDLLKDNPHNADDPFIFYSSLSDKPTEPHIIREGLNNALKKIKVDYKGRYITYHSWRHFFCSQMTQQIEGEKVAKVSDHLSEGVFKKYADHIETKNIQEVGNAAAQVFKNIVKFRKAG